MKKHFSIILVIALLICTIPNFAFAQESSVHIGGEYPNMHTTEKIYDNEQNTFYLTRIVTSDYSQAILKDVNNNTIAEYTYKFNDKSLYDLNKTKIASINDNGTVDFNALVKSIPDDINWGKGSTVKGSLKIASIGSFAVGTMICALVPGVGWGIALEVANYAIALGISSLYYKMKVYMATDGTYDYVKRVTSFYSDNDYSSSHKLGPTCTGIQKKAIK